METRLGEGSLPYGVVAGVDVLDSWARIDDHTLQAVSQLTDERVNNLVNLQNTFDSHDYDTASSGFHYMLRGHIGERFAADSFTQAGAHVEFYPASNHAGADFLVDGHPINVKVTSDAGQAASEHFAQYPETPIVVNGDAGNIPPDAVYFDPATPFNPDVLQGDHVVLVDTSLHLDVVDSTTTDAIGAADAGAGLADIGFPAATALIAAGQGIYREWGLLKAGDTTVRGAAINVGKDVTTRGGMVWSGAAVGFKVGMAVDAATGGVLLGVPTLLLTAGAAIVGGKSGRRVAKWWREAPLRKAQGVHDVARAAAVDATERANLELTRKWNRELRSITQRLNRAAASSRARLGAELQHTWAQLRICEMISDADLNAMLDRAATDIATSQSPRARRTRGPLAVVERRADASALRRAERSWAKARAASMRLPDPRARLVAAFDVAVVCDQGRRDATGYLDHVSSAREEATRRLGNVAEHAAYDVLLARWRADLEFADLTSRWTVRATELEFAMEATIKEYQAALEGYIRACRKSGYQVTESDVEGKVTASESV